MLQQQPPEQQPAEATESSHTDLIHDEQALASMEAGLDALTTPPPRQRRCGWRQVVATVAPPLVALMMLVAIWQALWAAAFWPEYQLPSPADVWGSIWSNVRSGEAFPMLWTSVHRAILGFLTAVVIATPIGLLVAKVNLVRAAIGSILSGLQSLPSVAWVPAAVLWFGLTPSTIFFVVLMGSVPSISNGLVAGIDHISPILLRAGTVMGANRFSMARHILLPAALPGYLAGLRQGWAFSWRSLMAAEIIANSPQLGVGLGQYLHNAQSLNDISMVISAIFLILLVGIAIEAFLFRPAERKVLRARGLMGSSS